MNVKEIKIRKQKIYILIILFMIFLESKVVAGYIEKINLRVSAEIAKPVFEVNHDEKIVGNYSDMNNVPEYIFEIKNYNEKNEISEINFNVKLEVISENKVEFEVINSSTNEVILNNNQKKNEFTLEKDKLCSNKYKVIVKSNLDIVKDKLKIIIDAKYFKYELEVLDINIDKRNLEYEIYISQSDKKYTNKDISAKIKCNKEIKNIPGFELSDDKTCLTKIYQENTIENVLIEDYYNNRKNIEILINNIDKEVPEIVGIEEGKTYSNGLKLIYKDNVGVKSIKVENKTKNQSYSTTFDSEKKVIDNQVLVVNNNSINPYYLNQPGNYTIIVTDFAENQIVKHINIK